MLAVQSTLAIPEAFVLNKLPFGQPVLPLRSKFLSAAAFAPMTDSDAGAIAGMEPACSSNNSNSNFDLPLRCSDNTTRACTFNASDHWKGSTGGPSN